RCGSRKLRVKPVSGLQTRLEQWVIDEPDIDHSLATNDVGEESPSVDRAAPRQLVGVGEALGLRRIDCPVRLHRKRSIRRVCVAGARLRTPYHYFRRR